VPWLSVGRYLSVKAQGCCARKPWPGKGLSARRAKGMQASIVPCSCRRRVVVQIGARLVELCLHPLGQTNKAMILGRMALEFPTPL